MMSLWHERPSGVSSILQKPVLEMHSSSSSYHNYLPKYHKENMSAIRSRGPQQGDLPPKRERKDPLRPVSPPLSKTPFNRFIYYLVFGACLYLLFYTWRIALWKVESPFFGVSMGKKPSSVAGDKAAAKGQTTTSTTASPSVAIRGAEWTVEDRIKSLAEALGMPSNDLAAVIADAVREHIPPASLSSVKAHQTG